MRLAASGVTHQGRRSTNEDSWLVDLDLGLLIVADGMGGHNAGEVASALAVEVIRETLVASGRRPDQGLLEQAVETANGRILAAATGQPDHAGMGTTVVAALVTDGRAIYASVGDSRAYLWRDGRLTQLTRDDSWLAETLHEVGDDQNHDLRHPMRHVLTKVVGLRPDLRATSAECPFTSGDRLLLCSDGVHGAVPPEVLTNMLGSHRAVSAVAGDIVRTAIARGASDNATAIVAGYD